MNYWALTLRREDVLTVLEGNRSIYQAPTHFASKETHIEPPPNGSVTFLWNSPPEQVDRPPVVIVPPGERTDFLAWVSTFLRHMKPFTAFCRVIESDALGNSTPTEGHSLRGLEAAVAGLIIAEAITSSSSIPNLRELSTLTCESTYFFTFSKALASRIPIERIKRLHKDWTLLRSITKQPQRETQPDAVNQIQSTILVLAEQVPRHRGNSPIAEACNELLSTGDISADTWHTLVQGSPDLQFAPAEMRANRERRVLFLDKVLAPGNRHQEDSSRVFALGYILTLFDNGASINAQLLPRSGQWESVLLWHGFTAGLVRGNTIESVAGGLGRRIVRDILQSDSLFEAPRADISLEELAILLEGDRPLDDFRVGTPNLLTVELAPCVAATVRWPVRSRDGQFSTAVPTHGREAITGPLHQKRFFEDFEQSEHQREQNERQKLLIELGRALEKAQFIQQLLMEIPSEPDTPRRKSDRRKKY